VTDDFTYALDPGGSSAAVAVTVTCAGPGAAPSISNDATAATIVGGSIPATATLAGGASPTGTITFRAYGPSDGDCSQQPAFTGVQAVAGNGDYTTDPAYTPASAGTYRWIAAYSGDADNSAVASPCAGPASVVSPPPSVKPPASEPPAGKAARRCKSLRRKVRYNEVRLDHTVRPAGRRGIERRITRLKLMIRKRGCR
jgi:hypothetical protein